MFSQHVSVQTQTCSDPLNTSRSADKKSVLWTFLYFCEVPDFGTETESCESRAGYLLVFYLEGQQSKVPEYCQKSPEV